MTSHKPINLNFLSLVLLCLLHTNVFAQTYEQQFAKYLADYKQDFVTNPNSPLKKRDLKYLDFFKADSQYRVTAKIELLQHEKVIKMPTSGGESKKFYRFAIATFKLYGKTLQLTLYQTETPYVNPKYKNLLFLPFTDLNSGKTTYGGGRYIDIDKTEINNGQLLIDFNTAYNPYCAYSHGYQCPLPPEENDLPIEINAGEKLFTGKAKK